MNSVPASRFPRTTAANLYEIEQRPRIVEIYNDERPGFASIYYGSECGRLRYPCRTVCLTAKGGEHGRSVIAAWKAGADIVRDFTSPTDERQLNCN